MEKISGETFFKQHVERLKEIYGREPDNNLIGLARDGAPIFALVIDKKIISEWGYSVRLYEPKFEVINIRECFS